VVSESSSFCFLAIPRKLIKRGCNSPFWLTQKQAFVKQPMDISVMIINVKNKNLLRDFIHLPKFIYRDDPNWVKPSVGSSPREFRVNANPAIRNHDMQLYLASNGKYLAGRIAVFVDNRYNAIHKEKTAFFGFFESQDSVRAAGELFYLPLPGLPAPKGCPGL